MIVSPSKVFGWRGALINFNKNYMSSKMDGVKISINHDTEEPIKKKPAPKKKIVRKATPQAATQRTVSKGAQKGGLLTLLVTFVVTAALVGGGIYAWQNKTLEESVGKITEDARSTRMSFQKELENLKNKLSGVESENEELKMTKQELEERVKLLDGAKKDFTSEEIGISFSYPAIFGDIDLRIDEIGSSTKFVGKFSEVDSLIFGGISKDYESSSTSSAIDFLENQGFYERKNKYYFIPAGETDREDYEIIPVKIIKTRSDEALLLDKKSFIAALDEDKQNIEIGENIGALINLDKDEYYGMGFLNKDLGVMPLESFEGMLKTVEVK